MTIDEFLTKKRLTDTAFAGMIGVSHVTVWRYRRLERAPPPKVMIRIRDATKGRVTIKEMVEAYTKRQQQQVSQDENQLDG